MTKTSDELSSTPFPLRFKGYAPGAVGRKLATIADLQEKGFAPSTYGLLPSNRNMLVRGYDPEAVDRFFAELAREAPPDLRTLPEIPHGRRGEGATREAQRQYANDCKANWQRVYDIPGVRLIAARGKLTDSTGEVLLTRRRNAVTLATGQVLRIDKDNVGGLRGTRVTDLSSGEPMLWTRGGHMGRYAGGYMLLPGRRCLVFPVQPPGPITR